MSKSKSEVFENVHVKLLSSNKKTLNNVGIYRDPSHGIRVCFLSEVEKNCNTFYSIELNVLCGDINIDLMKIDKLGSSYVDMMLFNFLNYTYCSLVE